MRVLKSLLRSVLPPFMYDRLRRAHREWRDARSTPAEVFDAIYQQGIWRVGQSFSGPGSDLPMTGVIRAELPAICRTLGVRSLLDAPCGDWHWMREIDLSGIDYVGVDVVDRLVDENQRLYAGPNRKFLRLDLISERLPLADLIVCRDCLAHLSNRQAEAVVKNFMASGSTYLLATTYPRALSNQDIRTGGFRPLNLLLPPISLPSPMRIIEEAAGADPTAVDYDKCLGLWKIN